MAKTEHEIEKEILTYIEGNSENENQINRLTTEAIIKTFTDDQFDEGFIESRIKNLLKANAIQKKSLKFTVYHSISKKKSFDVAFRDFIITNDKFYIFLLPFLVVLIVFFVMNQNLYWSFWFGSMVYLIGVFVFIVTNNFVDKYVPTLNKYDLTLFKILIIIGAVLFSGTLAIFMALDKTFQDIYYFYLLTATIVLTMGIYQWVIKPVKDKEKEERI